MAAKLPSVRSSLLKTFLLAALLGYPLCTSKIVGDTLRSIEYPIDFSARKRLGAEPKISPRLKVFALDDAFRRLHGNRLWTPTELAQMIDLLAQQNPQRVVLDDALVFLDAELRDIQVLADTLRKHRLVVAGLFSNANNQLVPTRSELQPWLAGAGSIDGFKYDRIELVREMWSGEPEKSERVSVPTLALAATQENYKATISDRSVAIDRTVIPTDDQRRALVNFVSPSKVYSLAQLSSEEVASVVQGNDIVFVMPTAFTGHPDFFESPIGSMTGGLVHFSVMNSLLTRQWLREFPVAFSYLFFLVFSLSGVLLGRRKRPWMQFLAGAVIIPVASLAVFLGRGIVAPWSLWLLGYVGSFGSVYFVVNRGVFRLKSLMEFFLHPQTTLGDLSENGHRSAEGTILDFDLAQFAISTEYLPPEELFAVVKANSDLIAREVKRHGGYLDKIKGDGGVCFFEKGVFFGGGPLRRFLPLRTDAERAFRAAIAIQRRSARSMAARNALGGVELPIRLGLHRGTVTIVHLGSQDFRFNTSFVSETQRVAQALQESCPLFGITFSSEIFAQVGRKLRAQLGLPGGLHHIHVTHPGKDDGLAMVLWPSIDKKHGLRVQETVVSRREREKRRHERFIVPQRGLPDAALGYSKGTLREFSLGGASLATENLFGKNCRLKVQVVLGEKEFGIDAQVRWSQLEPTVVGSHRYLHGVKFLDTEAAREFVRALEEHCAAEKDG